MDRMEKIKAQRLDASLETKFQLEEEVVKQIKKSGVWDIFKTLENRGIPRIEIEKFFNKQYLLLNTEIFQHEQWYSNNGEIMNPASYCQETRYEFPQHAKAAVLDERDRQDFCSAMEKISKGERSERKSRTSGETSGAEYGGAKAASAPKAAEREGVGGAGGADEESPGGEEDVPNVISTMIDEQLNQFNTLMEEINQKMMEQQMATEVQDKSNELKREISRLMALAKSGAIDVSFVVIALAKFNMTKSGALVSAMGKQMFYMNEKMNNVTAQLAGGGALDFAQMQVAQNKTRDLNFQMQLGMSNLQKTIQDITNVLQQAHDMIEKIHQTRRSIVANIRPT